MIIIPEKSYRIKSGGSYFLNKYGTENPIITIENKALVVFEMGLFEACIRNNWAARLFLQRMEDIERIPIDVNQVYYGKIKGLGECVLIDELEELES
jgi:hypothetical protein